MTVKSSVTMVFNDSIALERFSRICSVCGNLLCCQGGGVPLKAPQQGVILNKLVICILDYYQY